MGEAIRIIYVDLDRTLLRIDLTQERLFLTLLRDPLSAFQTVGWYMEGGLPRLKMEIARRSVLDVAHLPYNEELLAFLQEEQVAGQSLVLATASPLEWAQSISRHLGIFDRVLATDATTGNLKGKRKLEQIQKDCGGKPFGYAGDSTADRPIFEAAQLPIVVGGPARLAGSHAENAILIPRKSSPASAWWRSLYPYQWSKNILVFTPALTAHQFDRLWPNGVLAFLSFSLVASALYLLNDFCDIDEDRRHPNRNLQALASGSMRPAQALTLGLFLFLASVAADIYLPMKYSLMLFGYAAVNALYSMFTKNIMVLDLLTLTILYLLRIFAGGAATHTHVSLWLVAFFFFFTLSLAHLKRYTELKQRSQAGIGWAKRPNYQPEDETLLRKSGHSAGLVSVLVLALYVTSPNAFALYKNPFLLLPICAFLFYWIERMWRSARNNSMTGDPLAFALTDRISYVVAIASVVVIWMAWQF